MSRFNRRLVYSLFLCWAWTGPGFAQQDNHLVYQIFVRSFADTPNDSAPNPNREVGDLKGIQENLAYLNDGDPSTDHDLEVGILWLMPIFPSTSYHGYDVTDYQSVNSDYGTTQDLQNLVTTAHQRGVRLISTFLSITFFSASLVQGGRGESKLAVSQVLSFQRCRSTCAARTLAYRDQ